MISLRRVQTAFTLFAFFVLLSAGNTFGQQVTGTILGRLTDTTGATVPGGNIQIQNVNTGFSRTEQADSEGRYAARNLPLGTYTVTVQQPGFRAEVRSGIVLTVASEVTVNVELTVGNVQEKVEVTAETPLIETTNATLSQLVSGDQLRDLPLNGRSIDQLALLVPGVFANRTYVTSSFWGGGLRMSVNGGRTEWNLYLLDGMVVNDHSAGPSGGQAGVAIGVEGIQEYRLLTHNVGAEYGRVSGGVVSQVTRSGTNEFHGSLYEFFRNNVLDARNFFNTTNAPAPSPLPEYRRNQFGGAAGGRIVKDRIFFFGNYEGLRQIQGVPVTASVPDVNARKGLVPNTAGVLQQVTVNPASLPWVNLYPLPNGRNFGDGTAQYNTNFAKVARENYYLGRVDFRLSDKDSLYLRYVHDPSLNIAPRPTPISIQTTTNDNNFYLLSETHIFSGNSLNEFRAGYQRTNPVQISEPGPSMPALSPTYQFIPGGYFGTIIFAVGNVFTNQLTELGPNKSPVSTYPQNLFQESDTYSTVRGAHSLKFGVDVQRYQMNIGATPKNTAYYLFQAAGGKTALVNLLAGTPSQFSITELGPTSVAERGWRQAIFSAFVQDDYRVRPNLTLNLGLRYELPTDLSEVNGLSGALINLTDASLTAGPAYVAPKKNFSPRLGLAWDPFGNGKTSVRAAAGLYYNLVTGREAYMAAGTNPAYRTASFTVNNPIFPDGLANSSKFVFGALSANSDQYHSDAPRSMEYTFEVQQALSRTLRLSVAYIGNYGKHYPAYESLNLRIPTIQPDGTKFFPATGPVLNPNFTNITEMVSQSVFSYNGLQAQLQKTLSGGLVLGVSYTYSKAMSDADALATGQIDSTSPFVYDPSNIARDHALSAYDQRRTFVVNSSYQMPWDKMLNGKLAKATLGGWSLTGIFQYGSGLPFNIANSFNNSQNNNSNAAVDRPNLVPGFSNDPINGVTTGCAGIPAGHQVHTPTYWYNPCAFTLAPAGTYGNLGRNTLTAPGLVNLDMTLAKTMNLGERMKLIFRAEFFNILNHANFALPIATVLTSSGAHNGNEGSITNTTTDNRDIQLGLKLTF